MKIFLIIICFICAPLFAIEHSIMSGWEKLSTEKTHPSLDADGNILGVNVVTGSYHTNAVDFVSKGIDPIRIERNYFRDYDRKEFYGDFDCPNVLGWYLNYDVFLFSDKMVTQFSDNILLAHSSGNLLHFKKNNDGLFFLSSYKGFMNDSSSLLTGQTHYKNTFICATSPRHYEVHFPDGAVSYYHLVKGHLPPVPGCLLHKRNASGSIVIGENGKIVTKAPDGTILNWIRKVEDYGCTRIETSDNKTFLLGPTGPRSGPTDLLARVAYPDGSVIKYHYNMHHVKWCDSLAIIETGGGRYFKIHYNQAAKVSALEGPGPHEGAVTLYRFDYYDGFTDVHDAKDNKTRYEYDKENRITKIIKYNGAQVLRIEKNIWDSYGCCLGKILFTGDEKPYLARIFEYDSRGNVLQEKLYGNLTGHHFAQLELQQGWKPKENGIEVFSKRYEYYPGEFNLLAKETDGISTTEYAYYPTTNLLYSKFVFDEKGKQRLRQFRFYDSMNAISMLIEDDGSTKDPASIIGCSTRKIKRWTNRKEFPGVGQPERLEETYYDFDTHTEKLIRKVIYHYDTHNDAIQEDIYDADGLFAYSLKKKYDLFGRCIYETDPLGNETSRHYDSLGNLLWESGPHPDLMNEHGYDLTSRRRYTKQRDSLGNEKTFIYHYDVAGACTHQIDERGNETRFTYDELGRKTQEIYQGAQKSFRYDLLDHVIEFCDEEGNRTYTDYNIRGQPVSICTKYTSGKTTKENFYYDVRGNCVEKTAADGSKTLFSYDFLDRVTKVRHEEANGTLLSETTACYNAFSIISTKDAEGVETFIEYDYAGREKRIVKGTSVVEKGYDALNFLSWQKERINDEKFLVKHFKHDYKGQLVEESCEENGQLFSKRSYAYDSAKKLIKAVTYSKEDVPEETHFVFDAFGRQIQKTDPLGNVWRTVYRDVYNEKGQLCPYKMEISPDKGQDESFYDVRGRMIKQVKEDSNGTILLEKEFWYDGLSNLLGVREEGIETHFAYEGKKQIRILEEANLEKPRETKLTYDACGRLIARETPLASHAFTYDGLGRVLLHLAHSKLDGSANEIRYDYDKNGKPLKVVQNGKETRRQYDENGRLIFEKQESGLSVSYIYDDLGRRIAMLLPDKSSISFEYLGPYLFAICRLDSQQKVLYKHTYLEHDLSGRALSIEFLDGTKGSYEYDLGGKITSLQTFYFGQRATYDNENNLTALITRNTLGLTSEHFSYNALHQLAQENGQKYTYDANENRQDGELGRFNQLISAIGLSFCWNEAGYLTEAKGELGFTCAYDSLGRMISYKDTKYNYDGLNRRIQKNGQYFLYDGMNEIGKCDEKGNFLEFRMLGEGKGAEMGATIAIEIGKKLYAVASDIRGNIAFLSDTSSKEWECYHYTAFGETQIFRSQSLKDALNPWRFGAKREDSESGFIFFGRRYYMPRLGRWISPDPLGQVDGSNLYAFVHNNPMTHFDLYGLYDMEGGLAGSRNVIDFCCRLYHMAMGAVEWIGKNLIPIPGLRDAIEDFGRGMRGGNFFEAAEYQKCKSEIRVIEGKKIPGHTPVLINGAWTSAEEAEQNAKQFSQQLNGAKVYYIYNASNGLLSDILECFALKFGIISAPERKIVELVRTILSNSPNEMIHVFAHSQGGLHLHNAGRIMQKGEKDHIVVNTFGSAKLIPNGIFKDANNYVSKFDLIPMFDIVSYVSACFSKSSNVTFLPSSTFLPLTEHSFSGETYQRALNRLANELVR